MSNQWNRAGHISMGVGQRLLALGLLWAKREEWQLPPENDRHPEVWVRFSNDHDGKRTPVEVQYRYVHKADQADTYHGTQGQLWERYWAAPRVRDILRDLWEVAIGDTAAYPIPILAGIAIGWAIFG